MERSGDSEQEMDDSGFSQDESMHTKKSPEPEATSAVHILDLSDDELLCILRYCSPRDLKALGFSCSRMGMLVQDHSLWHSVDAREQNVGEKRLNWILSYGLSNVTTELKLRGFADETSRYLEETNMKGHCDCSSNNYSTPSVILAPNFNRGPPIMNYFPEHQNVELTHTRVNSAIGESLISGTTLVVPEAERRFLGPQNTVTRLSLQQLILKCPKLTTLALEHCNIDCKEISVSDFPSTLRVLSMRGSKCFSPSREKAFFFQIQDHMPQLEELDVSFCDWFEASSLLPLSKLPNLKRLYMRGCRQLTEFVAYASLATRYGFFALQVVDLRECPVGDSEVSSMGWVRALEELYVSPAVFNNPPVDIDDLLRTSEVHEELDPWETEVPEYFRRKTLQCEEDRPKRSASFLDQGRKKQYKSFHNGNGEHSSDTSVNGSKRKIEGENDFDSELERKKLKVDVIDTSENDNNHKMNLETTQSGSKDTIEGIKDPHYKENKMSLSSDSMDEDPSTSQLKNCVEPISIPIEEAGQSKISHTGEKTKEPYNQETTKQSSQPLACNDDLHLTRITDDMEQTPTTSAVPDVLQSKSINTEEKSSNEVNETKENGMEDGEERIPSFSCSSDPHFTCITLDDMEETPDASSIIEFLQPSAVHSRNEIRKTNERRKDLPENDRERNMSFTCGGDPNFTCLTLDEMEGTPDASSIIEVFQPAVEHSRSDIRKTKESRKDHTKSDKEQNSSFSCGSNPHFTCVSLDDMEGTPGTSEVSDDEELVSIISKDTDESKVKNIDRSVKSPLKPEDASQSCTNNNDPHLTCISDNIEEPSTSGVNSNESASLDDSDTAPSSPNRTCQNADDASTRRFATYMRFRQNENPVFIERPIEDNPNIDIPPRRAALVCRSANPRLISFVVSASNRSHGDLFLPIGFHGLAAQVSELALDPYVLVSNAAVQRFGRSDSDNVNYIDIGPRGVQPRNAMRPDRSNLRIISITGYRTVTGRSLRHLATSAPFLKLADFRSTCVNATDAKAFNATRPDCKVLYGDIDDADIRLHYDGYIGLLGK